MVRIFLRKDFNVPDEAHELLDPKVLHEQALRANFKADLNNKEDRDSMIQACNLLNKED